MGHFRGNVEPAANAGETHQFLQSVAERAIWVTNTVGTVGHNFENQAFDRVKKHISKRKTLVFGVGSGLVIQTESKTLFKPTALLLQALY